MTGKKSLYQFLIISGILMLIFTLLDVKGAFDHSAVVKYTSIAFCFLISLKALVERKRSDPTYKRADLFTIALFSTLLADTFLILLDKYYSIGVFCFCMVQTIYAFLLPHPIRTLRIRAGAFFALLLVFNNLNSLDFLSALAAYSIVNLFINVRIAWTEYHEKRESSNLLFLGLLLFFLCDITVGLHNITAYTSNPYLSWFADRITLVTWLFYLPSQVLITLYGIMFAEKASEVSYIREGTDTSASDHNDSTVKKFFSVCLVLVTILFIISSSIAAPILIRPFYYRQIDDLAILDWGYSKEQVIEAYNDTVDYCLGLRDDFKTGDLVWSEDGKAHFTDCKKLFIFDLRVFMVSAGILILFICFNPFFRLRPAKLGKHMPFFWAGSITWTVFLAFILFGLLDFNRLFIVFHTLFFPGKNNWIFDNQYDEVINILPEQFFINCAILIVTLITAECLIAVFTDVIYKRKEKRAAS